MLEKNEKNFKMFCDAHFHLTDCIKNSCDDFPEKWAGCSCALNKKEWDSLSPKIDTAIFYSLGIHPQFIGNEKSVEEELLFLEKLCKENNPDVKKLSAIGEIGFDFFTDELKANSKIQEEVFNKQIDIALKYNKPVVIHCRKATEKLFENAGKLSKLPVVLFHSFSGSIIEANSLLNKGINAYFSFGKQILNNNKKAIECVSKLPLKNLLLETDAPYQKLYEESKTFISDIQKVYEAAYELRTEKITSSEFSNIMFENLLYLYHDK